MSSSIPPDDELTPFCPFRQKRHSEIRAERPSWSFCGFCGQRFSAAAPSSQPVVQTSASQQLLSAAGSFEQRPPQNCAPHAQSTSISRDSHLSDGIAQNVAPRQPAASHLQTHVSRVNQPTLLQAVSQARQQRADSLASLERDKNGLARQRDSLSRMVPVTVAFFASRFRSVVRGIHLGRQTVDFECWGKSAPVSMLLGTTFPNEEALLGWLFPTVFATVDLTGGIPAGDWHLCTTLDKGTSKRPSSWTRPAWDPTGPVSLIKYKDMVHEGDGREKDPSRLSYISGMNPKTARKLLVVFVITEYPVHDNTPPTEVDEHALRLQPAPRAPLRQMVRKPIVRACSITEEDPTDEDLMVTPYSAHPSPEPSTQLDMPRGPLPSRPASSSIAAPSAVPPSIAPSMCASTGVAPSTFASPSLAPPSLDLPAIALTSLALSRLDSSIQPACMEKGAQQMAGFQGTWIRSPSEEEHFQSAMGGIESGCIQPADLLADADGASPGRDQDVTPAAGTVATGSGPVEEGVDDLVVQAVPKKRKRPSPGAGEGNGGGKAKKGKGKARDPPHSSFVSTRQSERIQARSLV